MGQSQPTACSLVVLGATFASIEAFPDAGKRHGLSEGTVRLYGSLFAVHDEP